MGDVVTFSYTLFKKDENGEWIPVDPVICHTRKDVIWEDLVGKSTPRPMHANSMNIFIV